ncbi:ANTAR domain-containing response regulator [Pelotalea chapellei]|uniref:ANTAR domain-containing protein n=1 Tax=Pelotalea chapellei TaxID=44671 RepID=A0ABS5U8C6_9BACT|nr:ANTAR domain-containing protein [Pelotalea chapellei]MBT1071916.1 ANTAR domain-containing protein [Pelotalea chapellei]
MARTALISDTDPGVVLSLSNELYRVGFTEIEVCHDGINAVDKAFGCYPDLVILGLDIPGKNGLAAAVEIRSRLKIPVLLLAERCDAEIVKRAADNGIAAFLTKPLRTQDLAPAIALAVAHTEEVEVLRERIEDLKETIEDQKVIEKAKGKVMELNGLTEAAAYRLLQKTAMDRRKSLRKVADEVLGKGLY